MTGIYLFTGVLALTAAGAGDRGITITQKMRE